MSRLASMIPGRGQPQPERPAGAELPNTDAVASLPGKDRRSARAIAQWINKQYDYGLDVRREHAKNWIRVKAIMRNIHYFKIVNGIFRPLRKKRGEVRAVRPLMKPRYRWELGRLNANQVGITATPRMGHGEKAHFWSERAEAILSDWIDEARIEEFFDRSNQYLLYYGLVDYFRYVDRFKKTVRLKPVPGPELFPIPHDAPTLDDADGIMRVQLVSRQWLELQDTLLEQRSGGSGVKRMAQKATSKSKNLTTNFAGFSSIEHFSGDMEGALIKTVWMKPNPLEPSGAWFFMVEDELFRARVQDEEGEPVLFNGKLPHELVYYTKKPDDFWGDGFCEDLYSAQQEANRQLSDIITNARRNRGFTIIDGEAVDAKDIQGDVPALIVARAGAFDQRVPAANFPATQLSQDVGAILGLVEQGADKAVGYESGIIVGQQEGRTEGGPATNLLNSNAQLPLQPVVERIYRAFRETFPEVLDMLRAVWPERKLVRSSKSMQREMMIAREDVPSAEHVVLTPTPMIAGGRNAMVSLLFQLRSMPADDGQGFEVKSRELRRSLRQMNLNPPGLDLVDKREQRILYRIGLLINDGQKPAVPSALSGNFPELRQEDHRMAIDLLKERILDPAYQFFGPAVKLALQEEVEFHTKSLVGGFSHPDAFDDELVEADALSQERFLNAEQNDVSGFAGQFVLDGSPVGLGT